MSLQSMSRLDLQELYITKQIKEIVTYIYEKTIERASKSISTSYEYFIPREYDVNNEITPHICSFHKKYMDRILNELKILFPDCSISHSLMMLGIDGKLYNLSKINDNILHLIKNACEESYIVVDWS
jgi:hypothetical protein